jgi:hypothetical protein
MDSLPIGFRFFFKTAVSFPNGRLAGYDIPGRNEFQEAIKPLFEGQT